VPMGQTFSVFFYRSDPGQAGGKYRRRWKQLVTASKKLARPTARSSSAMSAGHVDEQYLVQLAVVDVGQ